VSLQIPSAPASETAGGGQLSRGKKALFSSLIFVVIAAVLEIGARVYSPQPMLPYMASADASLVYELNPHWPEFNSLGMRQAEITPAMLKDHFVIAAIGDSHTFGMGSIDRERAFPARLQHHLATVAAQPITVLNFGVPGYNMAQELEVLRAKALPLRPDLVVLQYTVNDEHISNWIQPRFPTLNRAIHWSVFLTSTWKRLLYSPQTQTPIFPSPLRQTTLLPLVERYVPDLLLYAPGLVGTPTSRERDPVHGRPHPPRLREQVPPRYWNVIGRNNLERDVRTFGEVSRLAGIPTLATGFIEDHDKMLYESAGFRVYSFFEMFKDADMRNYGYKPTNTAGHFRDEGSDFIAAHLAAVIQAHFDLAIRRPRS
jgi:GDSL-like lipase/acylhydrolase family protein